MNLKNVLPINQQNLEHQTTDSIRNLILNRELQPRTHLTETILSEGLEVSRAVIRTALQRLKHEGLLIHRPNKGMFVVELTSRDVWEIYTLRNKFEVLATELVSMNMNSDKRKILQSILEKMRNAALKKDYEESHKLDWIFHQKIIEMSDHNRLRESYRLLAAQTRLFLSLTKDFHLDSEDILQLHEPIIEAMLNENTELAAKLMSNHITEDGRLLIQSLEKQLEEKITHEKYSKDYE